jgi:hypothetical protein
VGLPPLVSEEHAAASRVFPYLAASLSFQRLWKRPVSSPLGAPVISSSHA